MKNWNKVDFNKTVLKIVTCLLDVGFKNPNNVRVRKDIWDH